jgi:hypothetical protein
MNGFVVFVLIVFLLAVSAAAAYTVLCWQIHHRSKSATGARRGRHADRSAAAGR